ncbi:hypothetical protein [Hydrotalea flava]
MIQKTLKLSARKEDTW